MAIHFQLIMPDRTLIDEECHMVVLPGGQGDLGVLRGHVAMVVSLRAGCLALFDAQRSVYKNIYVESGTAEILPDQCTVLSEMAEPYSEISIPSLEVALSQSLDDKSKAELREKIKRVTDPPYGAA